MNRQVGKVGPLGPPAEPQAVRVARLLEGQAKVTGAASNLGAQSRVARESQRDRDIFTAARERPTHDTVPLARAAAAAATGDQQRPPRRSWIDLFKIRRRRRQ